MIKWHFTKKKYFNCRYGSCPHKWIQFCCQAIQSDNFQDSPRNFLLGSFLLSSLFPFLLSICQIWWLKDDFAQSDHNWVCSRYSKYINIFIKGTDLFMYTIAHSFGSNWSDYLLGDSCFIVGRQKLLTQVVSLNLTFSFLLVIQDVLPRWGVLESYTFLANVSYVEWIQTN